MAVVEPADVAAFMEICAKWDVEAVDIGEVTDTGRLHIDWHGERVVDVPPRSVAHDGPTYQRPFARPDWQDELQADDASRLARPATGAELRETVLRLRGTLAGWNCRDVSFVVEDVTFEDFPPEQRARLNAIETRLKLPADQVDLLISAGREAVQSNVRLQQAFDAVRRRAGVAPLTASAD